MRPDYLLALLLATSAFPFGAAMMSAPNVFPKLPGWAHQTIFWAGLVFAAGLWLWSGAVAMQMKMPSGMRFWSLIATILFAIGFLASLGLFLRAKPSPRNAELTSTASPQVGHPSRPSPAPTTVAPGVNAHVQQEQRVAVATQVMRAPPPPPDASAERSAMLRQLTTLYITDHDGISSQMMAGLELPPADWLNAELKKLRANWRVRRIDGPHAETYDVPVTPRQPEDENGFGQNDVMDLGSVTEPGVDETKGVVTFRAMFTDWRFDPSAPFVFRNFNLRITHSDSPQKFNEMGVKVQTIENVTAEIVSRR